MLAGRERGEHPVEMGGAPRTRYATSGELNIAYQVFGDGDVDVVFVPGFVSHLELMWEPGPFGALMEGLGRFARVIAFDKRGTGLSDRAFGAGTIEERMDDVRAVMDAAGVERAALVGLSEGGPMSLLFAATHPERVQSLALFGSFARTVRGPGYDAGLDRDEAIELVDTIPAAWGTGRVLAYPTAHTPPGEEAMGIMARFERNASTPRVAHAIMRANLDIDVRHVLPTVSAPTLIVHCTGDPFIEVEHGRYLAEHIPGARLVEFPGDFHVTWRSELYTPVLEALEEFLTGEVHAYEADRVLQTVMFTDIVDSTKTASELGDSRWREVLDAHDRAVRREVRRHRGREISTTGDGFLVAFDGPARGIRCAHAVVAAAAELGIRVRAGLHAGECERRGHDLAGVAVHIGARVASAAGPDEVLVSSTVRDLVAGSGLVFEDRGDHELKGVPGPWRLLLARPEVPA